MTHHTLKILAAVVLANLALWGWLNRPQNEVAYTGLIRGVSFSPYRGDENPNEGRFPTTQEIEQDIQSLSTRVGRLRTYSALDGIEQVPAIAKKYGLPVTAGAWLDTRKDRNEKEIQNLIRIAHRQSNVDRLIVGNETILRGDFTVAELTKVLRNVRKRVKQPVSTAEPWHVWIKHPELANEVDFIAAHILPYWEGVPIDDAIQFTLARYEQLRKAFPNKPILIAEVGWPSHGNRLDQAQPSQVNQAKFLRRFLELAQQKGFDYFVMEAFDQPWKRSFEGTVGAYWGVMNDAREAKFAMSGPIFENPYWPTEAAIAGILAMLPMAWFLYNWSQIRAQGRVFYAALIQLTASACVWAAFVPFTEYMSSTASIMWGLLLPAQLLLMIVVLINGLELTEMTWLGSLRRKFEPLSRERAIHTPKISIHLPICNEPPEVVAQTLDSLAGLDYPNFEVLVIDNNTKDPALWKPVERHCQRLGPSFRFFSLGSWPGFKAGALNFALKQTAPDAEVIAVVDSDYIVEPDWLIRLIPYFDDPKIGFVQAPQDHRDWQGDLFQEMCNFEYAGFFHIGMIHRNERDAIIQHGTMTMIRRRALANLGGWAEWCICEDAELGLRLLEAGYQSVYVNHVFGRGVTAQSFAGYKGQRYRWAYGAVQIMKRHWRALLPGRQSTLTAGQRYHFIAGWGPWFADGLQLLFTLAALFWTIGLIAAPKYFEFPITVFLIPTVGMFAFKILHCLWLYKRNVPSTPAQRIGAALAATALTHTIARAMLKGLVSDAAPFFRTPKAENKPAVIRAIYAVREEALMFLGLSVAAMGIAFRFGLAYSESRLWVAVLVVQALPCIAATFMSLLNAVPVRREIKIPATQSAALDRLDPAPASTPMAAEAALMGASDRQAA